MVAYALSLVVLLPLGTYLLACLPGVTVLHFAVLNRWKPVAVIAGLLLVAGPLLLVAAMRLVHSPDLFKIHFQIADDVLAVLLFMPGLLTLLSFWGPAGCPLPRLAAFLYLLPFALIYYGLSTTSFYDHLPLPHMFTMHALALLVIACLPRAWAIAGRLAGIALLLLPVVLMAWMVVPGQIAFDRACATEAGASVFDPLPRGAVLAFRLEWATGFHSYPRSTQPFEALLVAGQADAIEFGEDETWNPSRRYSLAPLDPASADPATHDHRTIDGRSCILIKAEGMEQTCIASDRIDHFEADYFVNTIVSRDDGFTRDEVIVTAAPGGPPLARSLALHNHLSYYRTFNRLLSPFMAIGGDCANNGPGFREFLPTIFGPGD